MSNKYIDELKKMSEEDDDIEDILVDLGLAKEDKEIEENDGETNTALKNGSGEEIGKKDEDEVEVRPPSPEEEAESMKRFRETVAELFANTALLFLVGFIPAIFLENKLAWILGLILGTAVTVINTLFQVATIKKVVTMDKKGAERRQIIDAYLRKALVLAAFIIAAFNINYFNIFAAVYGVIIRQFAAVLQPLMHNMYYKILRKGR